MADLLSAAPAASRWPTWSASASSTACALQVTPDVLVPRPDTETLVDWALEICVLAATPAPRVLDLGTGSGAIALAIKHALPAGAGARQSTSARRRWRVARANARAPGLARAVAAAATGGMPLEPGSASTWSSANPPYIAAGDPHSPRCATSRDMALARRRRRAGCASRASSRGRRPARSPAPGCCWSTATTKPPPCSAAAQRGLADVCNPRRPGRSAALQRRATLRRLTRVAATCVTTPPIHALLPRAAAHELRQRRSIDLMASRGTRHRAAHLEVRRAS